MPTFAVLHRKFALWTFVALLLIGFQTRGFADASSATFSLEITDLSGAVIQDASVVIRNTDTNQEQRAFSRKDGMITFSFLRPGHYALLVSKQSFADTSVNNITLSVGDDKYLQLSLEIGTAAQSVTVDGNRSTVNTTDASVSTVIDRTFVENIPLNGRSFQDLISMAPGVVTQSPQIGGGTGAAGDFSVNGQRTESNYYMVDGVSANFASGNGNGAQTAATSGSVPGGTVFGTTQSLLSVDALQEFRVLSSSYSAEFGRTPGGQIALLSRSGTDNIHGSAFDYLRNNYFDANDWFNDHYGDPITPLRQNDFGGTLGGPIILPKLYNGKDKSFFFLSYEGLRLTQPQAASLEYVPSNSLRAAGPSALQPILNAFPLPTGAEIQIACDDVTFQCPAGEPLGTMVPSGLSPFVRSYSLPGQIDSTSLRSDYTFNPKLAAFFRLGYTPSSISSRVLSTLIEQHTNTTTYTLGATSSLSNNLTNEFRLGYARNDASVSATIDTFGSAVPVDLVTAMGLGGYPSAEPTFFLYLPGVGSSFLAAAGPSGTRSEGRQWNVIDTLSASSGMHKLRFGIDFRRIKSPSIPENPLAEALFESANSVLANDADLLDLQKSTSSEPIFKEIAVFAQDEWHVASRLNLSLGLRWEVNPPPTGAHGEDAYTLLGSIGNPASLTLAPQGTPLWKTAWFNFAPRLGMAWIAHNAPGRETVARAGGGVFFDTNDQVASYGFEGLGFKAESLYVNTPVPVTPSELDFTTVPSAPYTSSIVYAFPQRLQLPYTLEWNVSVEQGIGKDQTFNLSYVGSSGRRLGQQQELSVNALNPNFSSIDYLPGNVTSSYHALQAQIQRRLAHGVQALLSYTWAHSLDFGSNYQALPLTRGNADFDVRHNFSGAFSWELPKLNGVKMAQPFLNGWGLDARAMARTAFPITLQGAFLVDADTGSSYYGNVDIIPGQPIYLYGNQYPGGRSVNPAAFSIPSSPDPGDAPRNFVRGFGASQMNLAARRDFKLYESVHLQFRSEAFNLFNHPNFGYVDNSLTDATFGQAESMLNQSLSTMASQYQQGGPRSLQFALRLKF